MSKKPQLNVSALSPDDLAQLLSKAANRPVTEAQIREIAEAGELLSPDGKIKLFEFTAWLASEVLHGTTD